MTAARSISDSIAKLREENELLREQLRQYAEALTPSVVLPRQWRLSPTEERLLRAIRKAGAHMFDRERGMVALYGTRRDTPEPASLDALVCKLKRKLRLARVPIQIEGIWGRGWRMTPESCAAYDDAVAADQAQWARAEAA